MDSANYQKYPIFATDSKRGCGMEFLALSRYPAEFFLSYQKPLFFD